jgi:hypothetical protein
LDVRLHHRALREGGALPAGNVTALSAKLASQESTK